MCGSPLVGPSPDLGRHSGVTVTVVDQCAGPEGGGTDPPLRRQSTTKQLVVKRAMTARPVETVTRLMTRGRELLSESDHPESVQNC
jgi:hypothetical protein